MAAGASRSACETCTTDTRLKRRVRYLQRVLTGSYRPAWFPVRPEVRLLWHPTPAAQNLPDADAVVATAWQTAEWVAAYPPQKGERFYLVQHYETWSGPPARVDGSLKLPLRKLVIARWLQEVVRDLGEEADYLPNGLDFETFGVDLPPEARSGCRAMMLYHEADWKGSQDGLQALHLVKERFPALQATLFGVPKEPDGLPEPPPTA